MKTTISEISTEEIVERLNSYALDQRDNDDYLTRLYMEDGRHYEDNYDRIISLLEKEAERRGLKSKPANEVIPGEIIKTAWWGNMVVEETHPGGPDGGWMKLGGDCVYNCVYKKGFRMRQFWFEKEPKKIEQ